MKQKPSSSRRNSFGISINWDAVSSFVSDVQAVDKLTDADRAAAALSKRSAAGKHKKESDVSESTETPKPKVG